MANKKISELTEATSATETMQIPVNDAGTTKRITKSNLLKKGNIFTVGATGCDYTTLQAAISAAVTAGCSSSNRYEIRYSSNVDTTVYRNARTGQLTLVDLVTPIYGIDLVDTSAPLSAQAIETIPVFGTPVTLRIDDGSIMWIKEEPGITLQLCNNTSNPAGDGLSATWFWTKTGGVSTTVYAYPATGGVAGASVTMVPTSAGPDYATGLIGTTVGGDTIDLTNYNYVSMWIYCSTALAAGVLEFFVSKDNTHAAITAGTKYSVAIPAFPAANMWFRVCVPLSAGMKTSGLKGLGFASTSGALTVRIDNIRAHVLGETFIDASNTFGNANTGVEAISYQLTPAGYAAKRGIPITHAIPQDFCAGADAGFMHVEDVRIAAYTYGGVVASHGWLHSTAPATYADTLLETIGTKEYLENLYGTAAIPELGLKVTGSIESGKTPTWNDDYGYLGTRAKTFKRYGQLIKRWFSWSQNTVSYGTPTRRYFGATTFGTPDVDAGTPTVHTPRHPIIINLHYITAAGYAVGTPYNISYTKYKAMIDALATGIAAGKVVCLTMPSFFDSLQMPDQATKQWPYAPDGNMDSVAAAAPITSTHIAGTQWTSPSANNVRIVDSAGTLYLELGYTGTAQSSIIYTLDKFVPGEAFDLVFAVRSDGVQKLRINVDAVHLFSCIPDNGASEIHVRMTPPVYSGSLAIALMKLAGTTGSIFIDKVYLMPRA